MIFFLSKIFWIYESRPNQRRVLSGAHVCFCLTISFAFLLSMFLLFS
ncbi:unnamed protein product, partial [Arabidopsis halleri]